MARLKQVGKVWYSDIRFPDGKDPETGRLKYKRIQRPLSTDRRIAEGKLADLVKQRNANKHAHVVHDTGYVRAKERFLSIYGSRSKITRRHYVRALGNLERTFPITDLHQLTPQLLVDLYLRWKHGGRGLYARNRDVECLLTFVHRIEAWGSVPVRDWEDVRKVMDREPRGRLEFFTPDEVGRLVKKTFGMWRTMTLLGARAGLRPGEMLFLEWKDVDWGMNKIHVDSKPRLGFHIKTYERRTIPMPEDLREHLWKEHQKKQSDFVLSAEDGHRPGSRDVMSTYFSRRVRSCGLKGHLYKLRHTYASHLVQEGVPLQVVRDLLGHRSIQTTEIYSHLVPRMHEEAVKRLPKV